MLYGIFDTETTGLDRHYHEVIDAHALLIDVHSADLPIIVVREGGGRIMPAYPERIDPIAKSLNGFDENEWRKTARPATDVATEILGVLYDNNGKPVRIMGSHPVFDRDFWSSMHYGWEISLRHSIDLAALAHPLELAGLTDSVKLDALCKLLKVEPRDGMRPHSARADCYRVLDVYTKLIRRLRVTE